MLTAEHVREVMLDCLFRPEEVEGDKPPEGAILVEGIVRKFGLHPERLNKHRQEIRQLLEELPDTFQEKSGGGMSFLAASLDKNGNHWGEHNNMEELFVLGMATDDVILLMPRDLWSVLPGGMPYYVVRAREA